MTRNSARKKLVRERASRQGIRYREAAREEGGPPRDGSGRKDLDALLQDGIEAWCVDQRGSFVELLPRHLFGRSDRVASLEVATVHRLSSRSEPLGFHVTGRYEGGIALSGVAYATLQVRGLLPRDMVASTSGFVVLPRGDHGERYVEVVEPERRRIEIGFKALTDPGCAVLKHFLVMSASWPRLGGGEGHA